MQIIRVRLTSSEKTKGCEKAPIQVIKALRDIKTNENKKEINVDNLNLEEIHVDLDNQKEAHDLIFENSKEIFEKNSKAFFIGGDHSISYSIVRAFDKINKNSSLVVFEAHADCLDEGGIHSENWLRRLIEQGFLGSKIILIGSRNLSSKELRFLKENKVTLIKMDLLQEDIQEVCDLVMERVRDSEGFYVSIDLDCVDPGFAPGVTEIEPGGLSSRELIYFIKRLSLLDNFKGGDIVEINPEKDINDMTIKLGAKLLGEMI
ncbi:MAG: arginase family protein [archaeon]